MSRFLFFAFILIASLTFHNNSVIAQDPNKDCEELKTEISGLQDLLMKETAQLQELKKLLEDQRIVHQKALDAYKKWMNSWSANEELRTKILDDIAKGSESIRKLNSAIDEANINIQAMKDVINDLLNKLANCGKKVSMKEKRPSNNLSGHHGNFELAAGAGYGFSFNNGLLAQNRIFTANDRSFDGVYGSWAQGAIVFIKPDFKVSECLKAGVEFDYIHGDNFTWDQNSIGVTSTINQHYESRYTGYSATPFIQFNPCGSNRLNPYVDLGLRLDFSNTITQTINQTQTANNNTTTTIQEAKLDGAFSTGVDASLGIKFRLSDYWSIVGELNSSNSNFIQHKATLEKYTINGADQLGSLNVSQKNTDYVKSYTVPNSGFDPNSPSKALRSPIPLSTIGIKFGLDYKF